MPRNGRSSAIDPGRGDRYTLTDGSQWVVLDRDGEQIRLEAIRTHTTRIWSTTTRTLLRTVHAWRGAGR